MSSPFAHDWLLEHARTAPGEACIGTPAGWTSYGELASRMQTLRAALAARGVGEGDIVMNAMIDGAASIAFTLAAQSLGACVAEIDRSLDAKTPWRRSDAKPKPGSPPSKGATLLPWRSTSSTAFGFTTAKIRPRASRRKMGGAQYVWLKRGTVHGRRRSRHGTRRGGPRATSSPPCSSKRRGAPARRAP